MERISQDFEDSVVGSVVGLAVGDALGVPGEFRRRGQFPEITGYRRGGDYYGLPDGIDAGYWTDDTSMALCLADSLIAESGYDGRATLALYTEWYNHGLNSSISWCFDIGNQTLAALQHYGVAGDPYDQTVERARGAGNGGIMRIAPIIGAYALTGEEASMAVVSESSFNTHPNSLATGAARVMNGLIRPMLLQSKIKSSEDILLLARQQSNLYLPELASRLEGDFLNKSVDDISSSGFVIDTLEAALWATVTTKSFEAAVLKAVNLGRDADTVGAVTGQLAGARYGYSQIPDSLKAGLHKHEEIRDKALGVVALAIELSTSESS